MKKLLLTICLIVTSAALFAQARFMGIEMGTPFSTFKQELQDKGFTYLGVLVPDYPQVRNFVGAFRGRQRDIFVVTTPDEIVWKVGVNIDSCARYSGYNTEMYNYGDYSRMKSEYDEFKSALTQKYGIPVNETSTNQSFIFYSAWVAGDMTIDLRFERYYANNGSGISITLYKLKLSYYDNAAAAHNEEHLNDDL